MILYDHEKQTQDILGLMNDDTLIKENIARMREAGLQASYLKIDPHDWESKMTLPQYPTEKHLYLRLLNEYEKRTGNKLNH